MKTFQKYSNYEVIQIKCSIYELFELLFELESDPVQIRK